MQEVRRRFEFDKETKRTRRYREARRPGEPVVVDMLYVSKEALRWLGDPEAGEIEVTLSAAPEVRRG